MINHKTHIYVFALILFVSCKKTYTCECNTTVVIQSNNGGYFTVVTPSNKTTYAEKLTEKQAKSACSHEEYAVETSFYNAFTDNGYAPLAPGESIKTSCGLK